LTVKGQSKFPGKFCREIKFQSNFTAKQFSRGKIEITRKMHLLKHYFFPRNEGNVVVASKQNYIIRAKE
jgi:hypothetical protein